MKNFITFVITIFISIQLLQAQAPDGFKYQAVVRSASGVTLPNQQAAFKFNILEGSPSGNLVYSERHAPTSNQFGLVNVVIGEGAPLLGQFSNIVWSSADHYIQIEVDINGGTNYESLGSFPLLSVPYALHAKTAANTFSGNYNDLNNAPQNISAFNNDVGYVTTFSEVDGSTTNELQTISLSGNQLTLSNGGGTITLPSSGSDNWGTQVVATDNTISGNGTAGSPLSVVAGGSGDDWGSQSVITDNTLSGAGTVASPLSVVGGGSGDQQTLSFNSANNQLSISNGNSVDLSPLDGDVIGDNWGTQIVEVEQSILKGDGTPSNPLDIVGADQSYRVLRTNQSGEPSWSSFGAYKVSASQTRNSMAVSDYEVDDFVAGTQFGHLCNGTCSLLIRVYSTHDRTLYLKIPGLPDEDVKDIYDLKANRSTLV
ncbi:MAG: hypothetical protein R2730_13020 [Chitinophagales bacterium]